MNAHDFWIYYQLIVSGSTVLLAISATYYCYRAIRFFNYAKKELQKIRRTTDVVRFDLLKRVKEERKKFWAERAKNKS